MDASATDAHRTEARSPRPAAPGLAGGLLRTALFLMIVAAPIPLLAGNSYWMEVLTATYLFGGLACAWNIIGGLGGQFSLGHGVFFAAGAYTTARLYLVAGVSPWFSLPLAAAIGVAIALAVSWPTFRLKGPFFAIATMAVNEVGLVLANFLEPLTGGPQGLLIPFRPAFSNMIFAERWIWAALMFAFMALAVLTTLFVRRDRLGHYLIAVRADETAARAAGVNILRTKLSGMALSAALTAIGGGLFAMQIRIIDPPTLFSLPEIGVKFALIALIGGIGSVVGPVLGAFIIIPAESWLRAYLSGLATGGHVIVLGIVLILAARFFKHGAYGAFTQALRYYRTRRARS